MRDQCGGAAMYCINYTTSSSWETSTASLQPPETLSAMPNLRRSRRQAVAEREARPQMWHGLAGRRGRAWLAPCSVADARPPPRRLQNARDTHCLSCPPLVVCPAPCLFLLCVVLTGIPISRRRITRELSPFFRFFSSAIYPVLSN